MRHCFVFVCERGPLEMEGLLLAGSFRRHYTGDYEMVAFAPEGDAAPRPLTCQVLRGMGVRIEPLRNKYLEGKERTRGLLMTNKFPCFSVRTDAPRIVYLDTDQLLLKPFEMLLPTPDVVFGGRPIGFPGVRVVGGKWAELFATVGLEVPKEQLAVTDWSSPEREMLLVPPLFNGGLVRLETGIAGSFAAEWENCWLTLLRSAPALFPERPPDWERYEQNALGLAVHRMKLRYELMSTDKSVLPLHHYHEPEEIRAPRERRLVREIIDAHPGMREVRHAPGWRSMFDERSA